MTPLGETSSGDRTRGLKRLAYAGWYLGDERLSRALWAQGRFESLLLAAEGQPKLPDRSPLLVELLKTSTGAQYLLNNELLTAALDNIQ